MAVPVRVERREVQRRPPALTIVKGGTGRARSTACSKVFKSDTACRQTFTIACFILIALTLLGMGRVAVTVKAAEAAVAASSLVADIEAERIARDKLEAHRNVLVAPPRIQGLAQTSMKMETAGTVNYIALPEVESRASNSPVGARTSTDATPPGRSDRVAQLLNGIMRMTAGEAQVLLVGDAGLTSSR